MTFAMLLGGFSLMCFVFFGYIAHMTEPNEFKDRQMLTIIAALFLIGAIIGLK